MDEPSGRYQVVDGAGTPFEQWASSSTCGPSTYGQYMVLSTAISASVSTVSTLVEKSRGPSRTLSRCWLLSVVWLRGGRLSDSMTSSCPVDM